MNKDKLDRLRERLAELEHNQWWHWSKELSLMEKISKTRLIHWKLYWMEYHKLTEEAKNLDRVWADRVINILKEFDLI